jgi:ribosomal protein L31E
MLSAYEAVRIIRQLLANHPAAKTVDVPDWLYEGLIWDI